MTEWWQIAVFAAVYLGSFVVVSLIAVRVADYFWWGG
jgi:hypothetical protein